MSPGMIFLAGAVALVAVALILIRCIRITPKCPQCEEVGEITDSNVTEAWLDCRCLSCGYKWRIQ